MAYLLPVLTNQSIEDGTFIQAPEFCKSECSKSDCKKFYEGIKKSDFNRFIVCPHGMTVYMYSHGEIFIPFVGMRCRGTYNKQKAKEIRRNNDSCHYDPILDEENFLTLMEHSVKEQISISKAVEKEKSLDSIAHEVKKLNAQIKDRTDLIIQYYDTESGNTLSDKEMKEIFEKIKTIYVCSSLISMRFSLLNYEKNPSVLSQGMQNTCNVYKKFDKMRIVFSNYLRKKVPIQIHGNSYYQIKAYPFFEMIPLLLIDNAVKYSCAGNSVDIYFDETSTELTVEIISFGPYCSPEEISDIFSKGFRGKYANNVTEGSGIGLFFVKLLCELHGINITATSGTKTVNIDGIPYAEFKIALKFKNGFTTYNPSL